MDSMYRRIFLFTFTIVLFFLVSCVNEEDHMKNGQLKPGYNVNVATVSEYIIGNYISADRTGRALGNTPNCTKTA